MGFSVARGANKEDIPAILSMAKEFWTHTEFDEPFNEDSVIAVLDACLSHNLLAVLDIDGELVGFVAGLVSPLMVNADVKIATELAWWVNPDQRRGANGIKLLRKLESMAKDAGAKYLSMMYMESSMPDIIKSIYEKSGYQKSEATYTRVL